MEWLAHQRSTVSHAWKGQILGGSGRGGMDEQGRNLKGWFLPGQIEVGEIVGVGLQKSHAAEQFGDVVACELLGVAGEKGW